jgi:hypothetical protein
LQFWFFSVPSEDAQAITGRGGIMHNSVFASTAPGGSLRPGTGVFLHGGTMAC